MMKNKLIVSIVGALVAMTGFSGCQDMFDVDSSQVINIDDYTLDEATDSVYSVIGILHSLQRIADKTVLIGELRGDLVVPTVGASMDLQALANFTADVDNQYNRPEDFYRVIQNCNYFLANVDTSLRKRNEPVFIKEYAAVKAFRAWTYLQLAQIYGTVPFVTEPIEIEKETDPSKYEWKDITAICTYFIDDLKPFVRTQLPGYGMISGLDSRYFFIPVRLLLGDLCLWSGRYLEAATYYHDYLTDVDNPKPVGQSAIGWDPNERTFKFIRDSWSGVFRTYSSTEILSYIPMESNRFEGKTSELPNVFNSTNDNQYYYQATISPAYRELSARQYYCKEFSYTVNNVPMKDTLYAPREGLQVDEQVGDLRLYATYSRSTIQNPATSKYSDSYQTMVKIGRHVTTYRKTTVYLRFAEALNRAGFPSSAFAVLKYGLNKSNIQTYVDSVEVQAAQATGLLNWDELVFTVDNTIGLHARGAGDADVDLTYVLPALASRTDSINYVENLICDEMALETAIEGCRFYDLMRLAMHRDDNAFLASRVATRNGASNFDQALYDKLMTRKNWFLPLE